jgi:hypothetical protein
MIDVVAHQRILPESDGLGKGCRLLRACKIPYELTVRRRRMAGMSQICRRAALRRDSQLSGPSDTFGFFWSASEASPGAIWRFDGPTIAAEMPILVG